MQINEILNKLKRIYNPYEKLETTRKYIDDINDYLMEITIDYNYTNDYEIQYPLLKDETIKKITNILLKDTYPKEIIPLIDKLYEYVEPEFLLLCADNINTLKIVKDKKYKPRKYDFKNFITGIYIPKENKIYYYDKDSLAHEFLHMASTPLKKITQNEYYSGFRFDYDELTFQKGLNEGYTELLTNRLFNNENYDTDSLYKPIVYILRIFELLYANTKYMEKDYFLANYQSPITIFKKYGTIEEYFKLLKYLDYFAYTKVLNNEDIEIFNFMKKIINRMNDDKIIKAKQIEEEYFESEQKSLKKVFSLSKK